MIARAAAPMATSEPIPTTGVARAAPAVSTVVVVLLGAGSPGRPEDKGPTTVVVADVVDEAEVPEVSPEGTTSVVVPDAGGASEATGPEGGAPEVGIGCPG
jgi:hypothetical protein